MGLILTAGSSTTRSFFLHCLLRPKECLTETLRATPTLAMGHSSTQDLSRGQRKEGQVERGVRMAETQKRGRVLKRWNGGRQASHSHQQTCGSGSGTYCTGEAAQPGCSPAGTAPGDRSRSEPGPPKGTSPPKGTGQSPPGWERTLSASSLSMVFLASSSLFVSSTISQSCVFLSISAFLI